MSRLLRALETYSFASFPGGIKEWIKIGQVSNSSFSGCVCGQPHKYNIIWKNNINSNVVTLGRKCSEKLEELIGESENNDDEYIEDSDAENNDDEYIEDNEDDESDNAYDELDPDADLSEFDWPIQEVLDDVIIFKPIKVIDNDQYQEIQLLWAENIDKIEEQDDGWIFYWNPVNRDEYQID